MERKDYVKRANFWTGALSTAALTVALVWGKDAEASEFDWCRLGDKSSLATGQLKNCENISIPRASLGKIIEIMSKSPDRFSQQDIEDVAMYHEIWTTIAKKYGFSDDFWILMWRNTRRESTVSRNPEAFMPDGDHFGAFGRSVRLYPEEKVREAAKGLEALADLSQRHPNDWREGAFFAWKINRDMEVAIKSGSENPLLDAQTTYIGSGPEAVEEAHLRWREFLVLREILAID
ncbi:hypothetical protein HYU92_00090 [Candidatus Curtissbacteria bacterium]|nr:hypothetical protein [Candidatus Curtissbacteria bacterium]